MSGVEPRGSGATPTRILRVIARLNVGGPSIQAITLTRLLAERGYETRLVRGTEAPREGKMDALAEELGVRPVRLRALKRRLGLSDLVALAQLVREIRRLRPHILHTHQAKAGTLGRVAALVPGCRPPVIVHTFHGHVLTSYFSPSASRLFTAIERTLARSTTCLVAVSDEIRDDLVRLGVAPADRIVVIPLGFDLERFAMPAAEREVRRAELRRSLGIPVQAPVVTLVARLEPIKRVDRFLRIATRIGDSDARFLVVGDGELRDELVASSEAQSLGERLVWTGIRDEMPDVYAASDVVAVTSDNEGTAVSAIEAQASRVPVVTTRVGGMTSVVLDGETGFVVDRADEAGAAHAIERLLYDPDLRDRLGSAGGAHAHSRFTLERLVDDVDRLYRTLLDGTTASARGRATYAV